MNTIRVIENKTNKVLAEEIVFGMAKFFNSEALWGQVFDTLSQDSTPRTGFEDRDARWDMLMEACEESLEKARGGLKARLKQKAREMAGRTWRGIIRRTPSRR